MTAQDGKWFGRVEAQVQALEAHAHCTENLTSVTSCCGPHQTSHVVSVSSLSIFFASCLVRKAAFPGDIPLDFVQPKTAVAVVNAQYI